MNLTESLVTNNSRYIDYMESVLFEEMQYILEAIDKTSVYMKDHLVPLITEVLSIKSNQLKFIDILGTFIDTHPKELSTAGPVYIFQFGDKEMKPYYDLLKINKSEISEMFSEMVMIVYGHTKFAHISAAIHKLLIAGILHAAIINKWRDIIECCGYLSAFSEYPLLYRHYWKAGIDVKEDVMNYTIEHLPDSFKVKKHKNLLSLLRYDGMNAVEFHMKNFEAGYDVVYVEYLNRVRTNLNSTLKNIARVYYDNYDNNRTVYSDKDIMDDGNITDNSAGIINLISAVTDNTYNKIITTDVNRNEAKRAAEGSGVSADNLVSFLNTVYQDKNNKLHEFIENILQIFLSGSNNKVNSRAFLNFGLGLYKSLGKSKNESHVKIRNILDHWVDVTNMRLQYSKRPATIIDYRKAMLYYFILLIKYYN